MTVLVPVLGDQLSFGLASLRDCDKSDTVVLLMEVREECTYVRHHKQKIALILSAMRHFAEELRDDGWTVDYIELCDPDNTGSLTGEIMRAAQRHDADLVRVVEPGEWRLDKALKGLMGALPCDMEIVPDDRYLCSIPEFIGWAQGRGELRMEYFYREMRRNTGLLMTKADEETGSAAAPAGGQWNYDRENRAGPDDAMDPPPAPKFSPDESTRAVIAMVEREFADHFGTTDGFAWPVTAKEAEKAVDAFVADRLPLFGKYQDAMVHGEDDLFHSLLSTSINLGLLDPVAVCRRAEAAYDAGEAPLNAVEGFIRQIIGWREYIRGMYWLEMPELAEANALDADRPLPEFYWTGETDMRCLADCVRSTRDNAHAHHIQRLMILGNFALIAGIVPQDVEDWFLVVYADAYEWVELPNVAAMALWADKGRLASKPYAAGGNYINRMSDYCRDCHYSVSKKTGDGACPFNALYWHFMVRNRRVLERNNRVARVYSTWDRMKEERRGEYMASADAFLETLTPARKGWARG
ncbi:cryptochrome/photolyase family protein [Croceicoccus hydrothermalis]|uniref:cryptochrome/photolyase family protein n=1 Tax=Croceicoccus hydrothermalis TaxID=2867964 RepID=UPI001EFA3A90